MITGVIIAESLRTGTSLTHDPKLSIRRLDRLEREDAAPGQPKTWTQLESEADEAGAEQLAEALADMLTGPGWYADFHSDTEIFVMIPGRIFRYPAGDKNGRELALAHGRQSGVPESQLDWPW